MRVPDNPPSRIYTINASPGTSSTAESGINNPNGVRKSQLEVRMFLYEGRTRLDHEDKQ